MLKGEVSEGDRIVKIAEDEARRQGMDFGPDVEGKEEGSEAQPEPEGLPEKGSAEDPLKEKEKEAERSIPESVFQKRFDEMTAERYELRRELDALKAKSAAPKAEPKAQEYTDDQLRQIILDYQKNDVHPEYAIRAHEMLVERRMEQKLAERDAKRSQEDRLTGLAREHQRVWTDLQKEHPDLKETMSDLYKRANEEYQKIPFRKRQEWPEEMQGAVERALRSVEAGKNGKAKSEEVRASAAAKKGVIPLGGSARAAAGPNTEAQLDKLHQAATESGSPESPQWMAYMRALNAHEKSKSKKKEE